MRDLDFLPIQYRQKNAYRHAKPWQIIAAASILGLLAVASISQHVHRHIVEKALAEITPAYEAAYRQKQQLAEVQTQLQQREIEAELIAYLGHPWPRSQLLSALISRLPEDITLQQLQIISEGAAVSAERRPVTIPVNPGEQQTTQTPAQRDLNFLHSQCDHKQTVIILSGVTTDSTALHNYLAEIQTYSLFSRAELGSATSPGDQSGAKMQFMAKIFVKSAYGRPADPAPALNSNHTQSTENTNVAKPTSLNNLAAQAAAKKHINLRMIAP